MMLFNNQVIMAQPQQAQQDQETDIKSRLYHLKSYLNQIKSSAKQPQFSIKLKTIPHKYDVSKKANHIMEHEIVRNQHLKKQIAMLKNNIQIKSKICYESKQSNIKNIWRIDKQSNQINPCVIFVYHSRIPMNQSLQKLIQLLKGHQWDQSKIFINKQSLILLSYNNLDTKIIKFNQIVKESLTFYKNFIKFTSNSVQQRNFILSFLTDQQAQNWFKFLTIISDQILNFQIQKWNITSVKCLQSQNNQRYNKIQSKNSIIPTINIQKNLTTGPQKRSKQKIQQKIVSSLYLNNSIKSSLINSTIKKNSIQNSIFNLSNSSQNLQNIKIKNRQQQLGQSIRFQIIPEELSKSQSIQIDGSRTDWMGNLQYSHKIDIQKKQNHIQSMLTTVKLLNKMEQKRKLLSQSSYTNLGIYWHDDEDQKSNVINPHFDTESISNNQSYSPQQIRRTSKKQSISLSPYKIKRVQSATRDKSNSRQSSQIEFQNKNRKKTDFSLQLQQVQMNNKKKNSKNQIRDHYLNRLIEKQTIKQMNKHNQTKKQLPLLIPIPERSRRPSQASIQNHSSKDQAKLEEQMSIQYFSESEGSRQSTQLQIQIQQLKNGIVLQKCSKKSWGIKDKRLYISNAMNELCYCDPHDSSNEKRIYIKDVTSIQYGRVSKGILKHKKSYQNARCLLIRINKQGKQKLLQFYLQQSQPCQNLKNFVTKLQKFTLMQNQFESNDEN